jgi:alpha-methylacyl-CoA racemase
MRPLDGIRIIEMVGLAPAPFAGMLLADFGADVVVVERLPEHGREISKIMPENPFEFGKRRIQVNLKKETGTEIIKEMIRKYDVLIEPYRPGVMESFGLGPKEALSLNPRLIYARLTGWGQEGLFAGRAGHDINYIALSGALSLFRHQKGKPVPPCNILGDFAGGGMLCAMGILLSLIERQRSGKGQVIDAAMIDGITSLSTLFFALHVNHLMSLDIGTNMLDGGAPFYQTYETSDKKFVAVGAIEEKFYQELLEGLGIRLDDLPHQYDTEKWPEMILRFAEVFRTKTRDEWAAVFSEKDACVTPVLELDEVERHPHNSERKVFASINGFLRPSPSPRLSRTPGKAPRTRSHRNSAHREILKELGYSEEEVKDFCRKEIIG